MSQIFTTSLLNVGDRLGTVEHEALESPVQSLLGCNLYVRVRHLSVSLHSDIMTATEAIIIA